MAKRKNNRLLIIGMIVLIGALVAGAVMKSKQRPKGEEVELEPVALRTLKETVSASGKVFPEKEVKISSDVSGEIVELYVEEGDSVFLGQLLAKIDPEAYTSAVERGEASLNNTKSNLAMQQSNIQSSKAQTEQIQAQVDNAKQIHLRNEDLRKEGIISEADYQQTEASLRQLEANLRAAIANYESAIKSAEASEYSVKSAEAALKELKTSLRRTTISAPTNGIISKLSVEQGERVVGTIQMTGTEMMRIANFNSMEVQVEVSENDILRVSLGDTTEIEVDAYLEETFIGVVTEIANSALNTGTGAQVVLTSDQVTNFVVKIRILPESYAELLAKTGNIPFRPGMSASVDIFTARADQVLTIPIQSVTIRDFNADDEDDDDERQSGEEDDREVVFVFDADTAKRVEVVTGIQDNEYIQIVSGLSEGEEVVAGPYSAIARELEVGDALQRKEKDKKDKDRKKDDD